jgi:excisionase family DNA binding protein
MLRAPLLTVHETADKLRVKESTIRAWIRHGELRAIKFGREWRIAVIDLETFLNEHANFDRSVVPMPGNGSQPGVAGSG